MGIIKGFFIDGFTHGDYTFGFIHITSLVLVVILVPLMIFLLKGKDSDYVYEKLKWFAIITLVLYFLRRGLDVYKGKNFIEAFWPFYLCNINTIAISIFVIFKVKKGQEFFILTGVLGAVLMFVTPKGVFNDKYLTIYILDSVLSHYEIVIIPFILVFTGAYKLDIKKSWQFYVGIAIMLINVEIIQPLITDRHVDYLFIRGTLPFTIEGVPQVIIMLVSISFYVYLVYGINYIVRKVLGK